MKLKKFIETKYNGNVTAFAKEAGSSRQMVTRMIDMDCDIDTITGVVTRTQVKLVCFWGIAK